MSDSQDRCIAAAVAAAATEAVAATAAEAATAAGGGGSGGSGGGSGSGSNSSSSIYFCTLREIRLVAQKVIITTTQADARKKKAELVRGKTVSSKTAIPWKGRKVYAVQTSSETATCDTMHLTYGRY